MMGSSLSFTLLQIFIVAAIIPCPATGQDRGWDIETQEETVSHWETTWAEVRSLLPTDDPTERRAALDDYDHLERDLATFGSRIASDSHRERMRTVRESMSEVWSSVGWFRSQCLQRKGKHLRDEMDRHYRERRFHDVILTHDLWLAPVMDQLPDTGRARARAMEIREDAATALEIEALGIEALEGGWILDHREDPPRLQPGVAYLPVPRCYGPHDRLRGKPQVRVLRFHEDHVTFIHARRDGTRRMVDYPYGHGSMDVFAWDVPRQAELLALWEERWKEVTRGGQLGSLVADMDRWKGRIAWPDLRERLNTLLEEIRPARSHSYNRYGPRPPGQEAYMDMDRAYRRGRYEEVIRIFHRILVPLAMELAEQNPDQARIAEDLLAKGEVLVEDARAAREVARFRLELLPSGMIVNHTTGRGKRYSEGDAIERIQGLSVLEISEGRVRCRYRDIYVLDLISP